VSTGSSIAMVWLLAADSDVVLGVARGIVGIAAGIARAEVRLSGGIDRLIGVAAGERERHKRHEDRDPQFASSSSMTDGVGLRDRLLAPAAASGVVLRVADGIVRVSVLVMAGEDLGGRLRRGIDRLIGVAAGKRDRRDREDDGKPHGRFPTQGRPAAGRTRGRRGGELGHQIPLSLRRRLASRSAILLAPSPLAALAVRQGSERRHGAN
jgi:hypothetical protein